MAQVTDSLLAEFQARVDRGEHINSTIHEEAQLLHAFRERQRMVSYAGNAYREGLEAAANLVETTALDRTPETQDIDPDDVVFEHVVAEFAKRIRALPTASIPATPQPGTYKGHAHNCELLVKGGALRCTCGHSPELGLIGTPEISSPFWTDCNERLPEGDDFVMALRSPTRPFPETVPARDIRHWAAEAKRLDQTPIWTYWAPIPEVGTPRTSTPIGVFSSDTCTFLDPRTVPYEPGELAKKEYCAACGRHRALHQSGTPT